MKKFFATLFTLLVIIYRPTYASQAYYYEYTLCRATAVNVFAGYLAKQWVHNKVYPDCLKACPYALAAVEFEYPDITDNIEHDANLYGFSIADLLDTCVQQCVKADIKGKDEVKLEIFKVFMEKSDELCREKTLEGVK